MVTEAEVDALPPFQHAGQNVVQIGYGEGVIDADDLSCPVRAEALASMDEVLILSTTKEIIPVIAVDDAPVAGGRPGPVTRRLQSAFTALTRGG